jgi:outer membrane immunogenic protein
MMGKLSTMKGMRRLAVLAFVWARVASAQSSTPWDGFYLGANLGDMNSKVCGSSTLSGAGIDPALDTTLTSCSGGGLVGGLQFGENFQFNRLVWGLGVDVVFSRSKDVNSTLNFSGPVPPPGSYSFSGKLSPNDFAIIGGRIGYGGSLIFPYLRAGGVLTSGSRSSSVNYVPVGATESIASFSGGKNFNSTGWAAGGGAEIGLNGAWSISAEYLHVSLGKGSSSATTCAGTASACAAFAGVSLDNSRNAFTANIIRIGINYWFNYWDKP